MRIVLGVFVAFVALFQICGLTIVFYIFYKWAKDIAALRADNKAARLDQAITKG